MARHGLLPLVLIAITSISLDDNEPDPSQFQRDVSAMLTEMGWNHVFEHVTPEGISLDLADPEPKRAIEIDGSFHYLKDVATGDYVVNGSTQFKSRLLRVLGWQITHVPPRAVLRLSDLTRRGRNGASSSGKRRRR